MPGFFNTYVSKQAGEHPDYPGDPRVRLDNQLVSFPDDFSDGIQPPLIRSWQSVQQARRELAVNKASAALAMLLECICYPAKGVKPMEVIRLALDSYADDENAFDRAFVLGHPELIAELDAAIERICPAAKGAIQEIRAKHNPPEPPPMMFVQISPAETAKPDSKGALRADFDVGTSTKRKRPDGMSAEEWIKCYVGPAVTGYIRDNADEIKKFCGSKKRSKNAPGRSVISGSTISEATGYTEEHIKNSEPFKQLVTTIEAKGRAK